LLSNPPCRPVDLWVDITTQTYRSLGMSQDKQWELFIPADAIHLVPRLDPLS